MLFRKRIGEASPTQETKNTDYKLILTPKNHSTYPYDGVLYYKNKKIWSDFDNKENLERAAKREKSRHELRTKRESEGPITVFL